MQPSLFLSYTADADATLRPHVHDGVLRLTVILKTTFSLVGGGASHWAGPEALIAADLPRRSNNLLSSPLRVSDLALFKPACDVLLVGALKTARGWPAQQLFGRLALARRDTLLLDKSVVGLGLDAAGAARAVESVALVWEDAFGGGKDSFNPVGSTRPSVRALGSDGSGCFAPIPQHWPSRSRLLDTSAKEQLKAATPMLSGLFPWDYFCAAPPDQRIGYLEGGERLLLEGMHAEHARVQLTLPAARACAWVASRTDSRLVWLRNPRAHSSDATAWALQCDTLSIDVDMATASLVLRGVVPIGSVDAAPEQVGVVLALGAAEDAQGPRKPELAADALFSQEHRVAPPTDLPSRGDRTLDMTTLDGRPAIPFVVRARAHTAQSAPVPGAPWAHERLEAVSPAAELDETVMLDAPGVARSAHVAPPPMVAPAELEQRAAWPETRAVEASKDLPAWIERPDTAQDEPDDLVRFEDDAPETIEEAPPAPALEEPPTGPQAEWLRALEDAIARADLSEQLKKDALALAKKAKPPA